MTQRHAKLESKRVLQLFKESKKLKNIIQIIGFGKLNFFLKRKERLK